MGPGSWMNGADNRSTPQDVNFICDESSLYKDRYENGAVMSDTKPIIVT